MKFLSKVKLSNRRYKTPEGYLVCVDSIIARTGKQEYLKSEIFQDSNDDSVIQIDRPKSEVLSPSTIASFENKPLVDEHPDEDVNVDNYRDYAIGFARDVRASKLDDVDILIANLIFTDPEAIAEIESGEKTELSCGYDCDILGEGDNLYQANIRGNHIALCKAGRAGIARIQDTKIKDSKWFIVYGEESGYMKEFKTLPEAKRFIKETQKFDKREGIEDKYYIEVEVHDSVKDSSEDDFYDELFSSNIKYEFIKGGYGIKFKTPRDYQKAKEIAKRTSYTKGKWYDKDLEFFEYGGITISNEDSVKDSKYSKLLKDLSPEERSKKIDELIADEEEAIVGYKEAMKYANEADKSIYAHIIAEELEHITELKTLRAENFKELKDSNIKDVEKKEFTYNGFDVYLVGRTSDDAHYEIRYKGKGVASCDYNEDPKKEIDKLNLKVVTIYGITTERKWDISRGRAKPERTFTSLSEAQYEQKKLEKEDGIPYVIFVEKEITYINNKKFFEDEENKKTRDGALRGIHLKKIRNTLRNEDEDLVEDFLDYMDTRPDLVKEHDDYSDYMVREDFETWKKYKKIKTRDADTYEEVTEGLEKELKDGSLKNEILKVGQRVHLDPERNKRLDFKLLKDEYEVVGFKYKGKTVKDDPTIDNPEVRDVSTIVIKSKSTGEIFHINRFQLQDSKIKDSDTLKNLAYKFAQMGNYFDRDHSANSRKILGKEDDEKIPEFYNLGLQVYKQLEQEVDYLKNNKRINSNRDYGFLSETVGLLEDGANGLNKIKDEKCKLLSKKINDLLYEYKKHTYRDSKVKDSSCTITVLEDILWDDEMRKRTRKYNLDAKKLEVYKFWKSMYGVWVISGDRDNIKKFLKENELAIGKNPEIKDSAKLLNIIKLYKKATKDSKLKDSMTKVNIETSLSIFDLQKAARKFDVIVILSNYTDHVYAILKGEKEDIGDLLSYLDNKGVLMKYPKGF